MTATITTTAPADGETVARATTVVTGLAVVAPNGATTDEYWRATLEGRSGLATVSRFETGDYDSSVAGEVNLDLAGRVPNRLMPQTDHMTRIAIVAGDAVFDDARVDPKQLAPFEAGIVTAASAGGFEFGQKELEALWRHGSEHVSAYQSFAWFYPVNTGQLSIRHDLRGPAGALVADGAGGLDAIAKARRHVREGTRFMVTGAVDGSLCPWAWLCLQRSGRLSHVADPARAYLPFDEAATGQVPGEGGALFVLEDAEAAAARGARSHGEIAGYGTAFDPAPGVPGRSGLLRAVEAALADAGVTVGDIDVVFADAAGVPALDAAEADVITMLFGPRGVAVTAPKTLTGRLGAGGGPLDVATALLSIRHGVIPATANVTAPRFADTLDLVIGEPRVGALDTALVLARGQGGYNSAIVVRRAGNGTTRSKG